MSKLKLQPGAAANKTTCRDPSAVRLLRNVVEVVLVAERHGRHERSPWYVRVGPSAFEQMELPLNLGDLCVARGRLFALLRDVRSVQITDEIATPASIVRESSGFEISFSPPVFFRNFGEFAVPGRADYQGRQIGSFGLATCRRP